MTSTVNKASSVCYKPFGFLVYWCLVYWENIIFDGKFQFTTQGRSGGGGRRKERRKEVTKRCQGGREGRRELRRKQGGCEERKGVTD